MAWWDRVDWSDPIRRDCPLNQGLVGWWMGAPNCYGGTRMQDLLNRNHGTLTNMDPATDWVGTPYGTALACDGVDGYIELPTSSQITATTTGATLVIQLRLNVATPATIGKTGFVRMTSVTSNSASCHYPYIDGVGYINTLATARNTVSLSSAVDRTQFHTVIVTSRSGTGGWKMYQCQGGAVYDVATANNGADSYSFDTAAGVRLGRSDNTGAAGSPYVIDGHIKMACLFRRAFTAPEVSAIAGQAETNIPDALRWLRGRSMVSVPADVPGGATPWLYARRQTQIIGGGMGL